MMPLETPLPPAHAVPRGVRDAVFYMRQAIERRITAGELARVTGVPVRTLHRQFLAFLGAAPLVHFRSMRLAAAHAALLAPDGPGRTVTTIATRFGFGHLGRFSADYRHRFGELPSATLARGLSEGRPQRAGPESHADPAGFGWLPRPVGRRPAPSLIILPLRTTDATRDELLLAEALAAQLATALSHAHGIVVRVARRETGHAPRPAAARYCLVGHVMRLVEGRIRITLRLLDQALGGRHLWGDAFDGAGDQPVALLNCVIGAATAAIWPAVSGGAPPGPPPQAGVRDLVDRAMPFMLAADADSAERALALLEDAIGLAPDDPAPVALAAWCRMQLVLYHRTPDAVAGRSLSTGLADRAAALDLAGAPLVLTARAAVATWSGQPNHADALLARALAIDPAFGWAWERSACVQVLYGKPDTALAQYRRAISLKPPRALLANCWSGVGYAHLRAGRHEEAARRISAALVDNPAASWLDFSLAFSLMVLDERQAALAAIDRLRRAYPALSIGRAAATLPPPMLQAWSPRLDVLMSLGIPA